MNDGKKNWSFLGLDRPKWSLGIGWAAIYALIPAWFVFGTVLQTAQYAGLFSVIAGLIALVMSIKHKSGLLMSFAFIEMFSYIIIVLIAGVNS